MKHARLLLWSALVLAASFTPANSAPLVKLTVRSYADLQAAINQVTAALHPGAPPDAGQAFGRFLGIVDSATFDPQRPWQFALWYEGGPSQALAAIKVPARDMAGFKEKLNAEGLLRKQGQEWTQLEGGFGLITLGNTDAMVEAAQTSFAQWKAATVGKPKRMIHLDVGLSDPLRSQLLESIARFKTPMIEAMTTNQAMAAMGGNTNAMGEVFKLYFDLIETTVKGLKLVSLGFDVKPDTLTVENTVTANPDTEFAQWLKKPEARIPQQALRFLDPKAILSGAGHFGKDPATVALFKKFMLLGFEMQNIAPDDPTVKQLTDMFDVMFPIDVAGSATLDDQLTFVGAYIFPGSSAGEFYSRVKTLFKHGFDSMVGEDKIYSSAVMDEKYQTIDGVNIDRFTLTVNTNSPLFSMPGQKEQLSAIWPGGKIVVDYALKADQLLFASAGRMPSLLAGKLGGADSSLAASVDDTTALVGYVNLLSLIKQTVASNPMLPPPAKEKLSRLDPSGTSIELRVNVDNQLQAQARVPMKFLREFGRMNEKP